MSILQKNVLQHCFPPGVTPTEPAGCRFRRNGNYFIFDHKLTGNDSGSMESAGKQAVIKTITEHYFIEENIWK